MFRLSLLASGFLPVALACIGLTQLAGCSGSSRSATTGTTGAIVMSPLLPATIALQASQQQQFTVSVTGANDTSVSWAIVDASAQSHLGGDSTVGTISDTGLYQAPATSSPITITLYAGASANTSVFRTATITVSPLPLPVSISLSPTSAGVDTCSASPCPAASIENFAAMVSNAQDQSVTWQVNDQPGGNATIGLISTAGIYTAPASVPSPSTVTVTAVSNADPTKSASALVRISQAGSLSVSLNQVAVNLGAGGTSNFVATVSPGSVPDPAVTWMVSCGNAGDCGSIKTTGIDSATYTAPSSVSSTLSVTVTATLDIDQTKTASATVTVASPVAPSMVITLSSGSPVAANGSITLTAQILHLPQGSSTPAVSWNPNPTPAGLLHFCMSSDEEVPADDNCDTNNDGGPPPATMELDGPGTLTSAVALPTGGSIVYTAPSIIVSGMVSVGTGTASSFDANGCSAANIDNPYVYIPVSASLIQQDGTQLVLSNFVCVPVTPNSSQ